MSTAREGRRQNPTGASLIGACADAREVEVQDGVCIAENTYHTDICKGGHVVDDCPRLVSRGDFQICFLEGSRSCDFHAAQSRTLNNILKNTYNMVPDY